MKPYDVNLIADYIILRLDEDEGMSLSNVKLQKLLYYLQAWSLGIHKKRFLNCDFEAWVHGPVVREIYDRFKNTKSLYDLITKDDVENNNPTTTISNRDIEFINFILDNYARFSGVELEYMTHKETPWIDARKGFNSLESCNEKIQEALMQDYYGKRWKELTKKQ